MVTLAPWLCLYGQAVNEEQELMYEQLVGGQKKSPFPERFKIIHSISGAESDHSENDAFSSNGINFCWTCCEMLHIFEY